MKSYKNIFMAIKNQSTLYIVLSAICVLIAGRMNGAPRFISFAPEADTALCLTHSGDTVIYDDSDYEGVKIAVKNLRHDLKEVTGSECAPIVVATAGVSGIAARFGGIAERLKGKWEQYIITTAQYDGRDVVLILGSDKRGTIYGIYELSRQIGVSPWYWFADAPIQRHESLYMKKGEYTDGEPAVKYRGIFINDEWPSFGTWCNNHFGGINSRAYEKIFELLLRLKANYFWPAMWASRFNEDDPESPVLADRMGIVMGTSHHEPMMRAHKEYVVRKDSVGPWDYSVNSERLDRFFHDGLERNKNYENIITIGMRGDGDVAMGDGNDSANIATLRKVIEAQRRLIGDVYGKPCGEVPQLWAIFTEVQRYYDAGFTVPDDVTLLFCDNNWGYIRRKGRDFERSRSGGLGLYYHIDMNGGPWNDRWINTTTYPKLREQLNLAYRSGLDRIWIINVGDLKPKEAPVDFIMRYAWNPEEIGPGDEQGCLEEFAGSIFGEEHAVEIADIMSKYSKYNLWRKPEVQYPGIFNPEEMKVTGEMWDRLMTRTDSLGKIMPEEARDAFFQLVHYPVMGSATVAKIYNCATLGDSIGIERLMEYDRELTDYYNNELAGGKWRGMMLDNHIGYEKWSIPDKNVNPLTLGLKSGYSVIPDSASREYTLMAYEYTKKRDAEAAKWIFLPDLGRGAGCMGIDNVMAENVTLDKAPWMEYDVDLSSGGDSTMLAIGILPVQDVYPERGLRIGVQLDDNPVMIIDARQGMLDTFEEYTAENLVRSNVLRPLPRENTLSLSGFVEGRRQPRRNEVFDNMRWLEVPVRATAGKHHLKIYMVDPEIVVEQIVVNVDNGNYSYFGNGYFK